MPRTEQEPIRVAVVNDYSVVIAGVAAMLAPFRDRVEVVERHVGTAPCRAVDLVLYDTFGALRDPASSIESIATSTGARVVVFSWLAAPAFVQRTLEAGAAGFIPKTTEPGPLVERLERIHRGELVVPEPGPRSLTLGGGDWPGAQAGLTAREAEILTLIVRGLPNQEIAEAMFLSINSVKTYIRTAYRKIGAATRTQAVLWGVRNGFDPGVGTPVVVLTGRAPDR